MESGGRTVGMLKLDGSGWAAEPPGAWLWGWRGRGGPGSGLWPAWCRTAAGGGGTGRETQPAGCRPGREEVSAGRTLTTDKSDFFNRSSNASR